DLRARQRERGRGVDGQDARMRMRGADEDGVARAGQCEVLDVQTLARKETGVLAPEDPLTHHSAHARESRTPAPEAAPRIRSAAFSAIIIVGAWVFARVIVGMTEAATPGGPSAPYR